MLIGRPLCEDDAMHVTSGQGLEINPSGEDSGDITQVAGIGEYDPIEQWPTQVAVLYRIILHHAFECCISLQETGTTDEIEDFISEHDWVSIAIAAVKTMGTMWPKR